MVDGLKTRCPDYHRRSRTQLSAKVAARLRCHKPCEPWSNHNKTGNRLEWNALHPKAKEFLFTEGTLQQLADDSAAYAMALIAGDNPAPWHDRWVFR